MNKPVALILHLKSSIYNLKGNSALKYIQRELKHTSKFDNIHIVPVLTNSGTTLNQRTEQVQKGISSIYNKCNEKISIIAYSFASLPVQNALNLNKDTLNKIDKLLFISSPLNSSKFCETLNQTSPCFMYHKIIDGLQVDLTWLKEEYNKKALKDIDFNEVNTKYLSAKAHIPQFPLSYSQSKIFSCSDIKYYNSDGVVSDSDMSRQGERDTISLPCSHFDLFALSDTVNRQVFNFYNKYLNE